MITSTVDDANDANHGPLGGDDSWTVDQIISNSNYINDDGLLLLKKHALNSLESEQAIERLCQLIKFPTVSSIAAKDGTYVKCANWLCDELKTISVFDNSNNVFLLPEAPEHSPVVVAIWKGIDPTLPILLLNSHYDVVPAIVSDWTHEPFSGVRWQSNIYGRGTQDMKCVCIQYIEAIRKIVQLYPKYQPQRSVYLTFVPDEEVGGGGMAALLDSECYKSLPSGIALALDEGLASTSDTFSVFYGERLPWWVDVTATGPTGHGSRFIDNTAVEQLIALSNRALEFRQGQKSLLGMTDHENCTHAVAAANSKRKRTTGATSTTTTLGDVTSLNITTLQAGVQVGGTYAYNCVPPVAKCSLDIRISPHTPPSDISAMLDQWCCECSSTTKTIDDDDDDTTNTTTTNGKVAAPTLTWNYIGGYGNDLQKHAVTSTDSKDNPWYTIFENTMTGMGIQIEPQVFPAATDSRFLRALGIRAFGFSPMRNTEIRLHENDEYIPEHTFLEGISVYVTLIMVLGSQGKEIDDSVEKK